MPTRSLTSHVYSSTSCVGYIYIYNFIKMCFCGDLGGVGVYMPGAPQTLVTCTASHKECVHQMRFATWAVMIVTGTFAYVMDQYK